MHNPDEIRRMLLYIWLTWSLCRDMWLVCSRRNNGTPFLDRLFRVQ